MSEAIAVVVGVIIGGVASVVTTYYASYHYPLKLEKRREEEEEQREHAPRKRLLLLLLTEKSDMPIRSLERLRLVTGTTDQECRRLLIELNARGVKMKEGKEGWALIDRYGFEEPYVVDVDEADV